MKDLRAFLFLVLLISLFSIFSTSVFAQNSIGSNWTVAGGENCTISVLTFAQILTPECTPGSSCLPRFNATINITNTGALDKTCEVNYTSLKNVPLNISTSSTVYINVSNATEAFVFTNYTDVNERTVVNWTSETVPADSKKYEYVVFYVNITTSLLDSKNATQVTYPIRLGVDNVTWNSSAIIYANPDVSFNVTLNSFIWSDTAAFSNVTNATITSEPALYPSESKANITLNVSSVDTTYILLFNTTIPNVTTTPTTNTSKSFNYTYNVTGATGPESYKNVSFTIPLSYVYQYFEVRWVNTTSGNWSTILTKTLLPISQPNISDVLYDLKINSTHITGIIATLSNQTFRFIGTLRSDGESCSAASECTGEYCVHGICRSSPTYCGDTYCDLGEVCYCLEDCGACPPPPQRVTVGTELGKGLAYINFIRANEQTKVQFEKRRDLNVFELNVIVKNRVNYVSITITKLDKKPAEVVVEVSGKPYRYINIVGENIRDEDISQAKIKFLVEKSWISGNNIDANTIVLYRFSDNKWNKLATTKVSEDTDYIYYEAQTPGFSYFAISGEVAIPEEVAKQTCPYECCIGEAAYYDKPCASGYRCENNKCVAIAVPCTEDWTCTEWSACIEGKQTRTCTDRNNCGTTVNKPAETQTCEVPRFPIEWIAVIVLVIVIIAVFIILKKMPR
ncbi:MAG: PGF-pre-PGF domain-containing protein [Candidatus Aenigmarchaeota archaeon]|nr:PGF-pre-PGF domain-containing protein [Candidatus Aenigmarchaeota archaeon]